MMNADDKGNIYAIHRPGKDVDPIVVLDRKGTRLRSWGKGMYRTPHGINVDPDGNIWTVDSGNSNVYKFSLQGEKLVEIKIRLPNPCPANGPCGATNVSFARNGDAYVADGYGGALIRVYDKNGKPLRQWGSPGSGPGQFKAIHAMAVHPDGTVSVADRDNGRLQYFDPQGKYLGEFKYGGEVYNVTVTRAGDLYITTHMKDVELNVGLMADGHEPFSVLKIDRKTGKMPGKYEIRAHQLGSAPDGTILVGTRTAALVLLQPRGPASGTR